MLKKEYETLEYGDLVRANGGPLRGLVLEVVNAEGNDIFTQQMNNPAFVHVRNYRCFDLVHHYTDLERKIQYLHDTVWSRNPYPSHGHYPEIEGTVSKDYYMAKAKVQFENRNEEKITQNLYFLLSENGVNTIDDLIRTTPDQISKFKNMRSTETLYTCILREKEMKIREANNKRQAV